MKPARHFFTEQQPAGEGSLAAAWIVALLLAGVAINGLAVASAAAGLPIFY